MAMQVVFFLCLVVTSLSRSAPVNDAGKSDVKQMPLSSRDIDKNRRPPFLTNSLGNGIFRDHARNDPAPQHWGWKDTDASLGIAKDLWGKKDESLQNPLRNGNIFQDHRKNDPVAHWSWGDTLATAGMAARILGKKDEGLKQQMSDGDDNGDQKIDQWANLAKDLFRVFHDQSDKPANDQPMSDGDDNGDPKIDQWANLAKDLFRVFHDQSDKPANDQQMSDGDDNGDQKMDQWANLTKDLFRVFHDQSDKPANDQKKKTVFGPDFGGFFPKIPNSFPKTWGRRTK